MTNPFEQVDGKFLVLVNHEGQYSLWPGFAAVPNGWTQAFGLSTREECAAFINENWVDLRPRSLYANTVPSAEHRP
ncbi:MbtH family protein [Paenibacillus sp. p3-SID867]|uniref:MbtH family protein n=1 Tax=Paenibacillus sp. p3-SID867 TaxID=2916363 RepID=UPI0021A25FD7|nr:MbtH family protein [Paenibacillus sp. p3-SID867]MCT1399490.1 MbtH family protein [Paenibacillus sp. p3-SID867]